MPVTPRYPRLAFVDLETTGGAAADDRITEVGIIEVDADGVREWSTLVNPGMPIPPFIQSLTGITNAMVADAPSFAAVADDIAARLADRVFIAHNARFDYGFLKNEFRRTGHEFHPPVLCTVRLSRKLFPGFARHNLDSLVERHRLNVTERHRALGDAQLIWQFWQKLRDEHTVDAIEAAMAKLLSRPTVPSKLDPLQIESIPSSHGVYLFYGECDLPLYIGKSNDLRRRVLAHFSGDHMSAREQQMSQQIERVEWRETPGELGALLLEAKLVKELKPAYNRQLRQNEEICSWRLLPDKGMLMPVLTTTDDLFFGYDPNLYGLFVSPRKAGDALRAIADAHMLCHVLLGLEKGKAGKACFASQVGKCSGACAGHESLASHNERVAAALEGWRLQPWPFRGAIAIREGDALHIVDCWSYLGAVRTLAEAATLRRNSQPRFDRDVYQILQRWFPQLDWRIIVL